MRYIYIKDGIVYASSKHDNLELDKECSVIGVDDEVYDTVEKQEYKALAIYWSEFDVEKEQSYLHLLDLELGENVNE